MSVLLLKPTSVTETKSTGSSSMDVTFPDTVPVMGWLNVAKEKKKKKSAKEILSMIRAVKMRPQSWRLTGRYFYEMRRKYFRLPEKLDTFVFKDELKHLRIPRLERLLR